MPGPVGVWLAAAAAAILIIVGVVVLQPGRLPAGHVRRYRVRRC